MVHGKYVEVENVILPYFEKGINVFYFCGGRGIGKTYSALDLCRKIGTGEIMFSSTVETNKFMYMRRTKVEMEVCGSKIGNPFKKYNQNEGTAISIEHNSDMGFGCIYSEKGSDTNIGYTAALSTFANLRGADFSDVSFLLYDECIPETKNKAPLKREGHLLLNVLETINRNRKMDGENEIVLCLLSNPIDLGSDLLCELAITPILNNMIIKGQEKFTDPERSFHIEKYINHPVSKEKQESIVYKFSRGTNFAEEALSGGFVNNDMTVVRPKVQLSEYIAMLSIENICVYKHKSREEWYISSVMNKAKYKFRANEQEKVKKEFYHTYKALVLEHVVYYDTYATKVVFENMIHYKPFTYV